MGEERLRFTGSDILGPAAALGVISGSEAREGVAEAEGVLPAARDSASLKNWRLSEVGSDEELFWSSDIIVRPQL